MRATIVKIDLCGSKEHMDEAADPGAERHKVLHSLRDTGKRNFHGSEESYPDGTYYRSEGDALYFILGNAAEALRAAVAFSKEWFSGVPRLPDCRLVVATDEVDSPSRQDLLSPAFDSISVAEKGANAGEILVDDQTQALAGSAMFSFFGRRGFRLSSVRQVEYALLNYEDPRLARDSALVHALFVAQPHATEVRARAFEVLAIEALDQFRDHQLGVDQFTNELTNRGVPVPDSEMLLSILEQSSLIDVTNEQTLQLSQTALDSIEEWREDYERAKSVAIESIANQLGEMLGLEGRVVLQRIDVARLTEEYLKSVFMDIRLMAGYHDSTAGFFERLQGDSSHDHAFRAWLPAPDFSAAQLVAVKEAFLSALRGLAEQENGYVAAVFHNALLLYYLNANERYANRQVSLIQRKRFFLDTNALYAIRVGASPYHRFLREAVARMQSLGAEIDVFDKSVEEYNESLFSALSRFERERGFAMQFSEDRPWIWQEFIENTTKYQNSFEFCVRVHAVPKRVQRNEAPELSEIDGELEAYGITATRLDPFLPREELGDLFRQVSDSKRRRVIDDEGFEHSEDSDGAAFKVLHDANCLYKLRCSGDSPYDTDNVFITADFRLARVRHKRNDCNFVCTVPEFQEFMLPYLLLASGGEGNSRSVANMILAASVDLQLAGTPDLNAVLGGVLRGDNMSDSDYDLLSSIKSGLRFKEIAERLASAREEGDAETVERIEEEALRESAGLIHELRAEAGRAIAQEELEKKQAEIDELKTQLVESEKNLAVSEKKRKGQDRYERAQNRRRHQK